MDDTRQTPSNSGHGSSQAAWLRWSLRAGMVAALLLVVVWLGVSISGAREAARRMQCYSRYGQIGVALHNYHDEHQQLPAAWNVDSTGTPLLSWRLRIGPYTDDRALFDSADLTQPWDTPANSHLLSMRPPSWSCPSQPGEPGVSTRKAGVSGAGTVFPGSSTVRFDDITDGLESTIYAGEISFPLPWTKPEDVDALKHLSLKDPMGFSGPHRGIPFGFCDGSSKILSRNTDPDVLRRLFLRNDGLAVTPADFEDVK